MENKGNNSERDKILEEIRRYADEEGTDNTKSGNIRTASSDIENADIYKEIESTDRLLRTNYSNTASDTAHDSYMDNTAEKSSHRSSESPARTENPKEIRRSGGNRRPPQKKKRRSARLQIVLILTVVIFTIAICLSVMIISVGRDMLAIGKEETYKIVTIPKGSDLKDISQILYDEGIIKMPTAFEAVVKMGDYDKEFKAGDYELSPSLAYETIIKRLTTNAYEDGDTVDITFTEGVDLHTAAMQLEEAGVCDADRFIYYFNAGGYDCEFEEMLPESTSSKFYRMEGYLFPDTYSFYVNMEPELVCQKIYKNFDSKITDEYYSQMESMGLSLDETITLASIVQAEAGDSKTMKRIASVFHNRLNNSDDFPRLESDPTGRYVNKVIKPNIEIASEAIYDAYDTYICQGLPSGAIGNPGIEAIEAVLYPEKTDYFFFYANLDTMETFFAETLEEHEENQQMVKEQQNDSEE